MTEKLSPNQSLARLQAEVHSVERTEKHAQGWKYATANEFLDALKPVMADLGMSLTVSDMELTLHEGLMKDGERKGERVLVRVCFTARYADGSTDDFWVLGGSSDRSGNGHSVAQAITDARKSAFQLLGNLYTTDDPERTSGVRDTEPARVPPAGGASAPDPGPGPTTTCPFCNAPAGKPHASGCDRGAPPEDGFDPPSPEPASQDVDPSKYGGGQGKALLPHEVAAGLKPGERFPQQGGDPISAKQLGRLYAIARQKFGKTTYRPGLCRTIELWSYSADAVNDSDEADATSWLGWKDYQQICEYLESGTTP